VVARDDKGKRGAPIESGERKASPTQDDENAFIPATALQVCIALPFVIPSEAEGSAVPRSIPGNVFHERSEVDLRFRLYFAGGTLISFR
jgi:hypothetical protein